MLDKKLKKIGTITVNSGFVHVVGFDAKDCTCREVGALALLWAIGKLQRELAAMVDHPGGTMNVSVD